MKKLKSLLFIVAILIGVVAPGFAADQREDDAHTSTDAGPAVLTKRTDTAATSAGTDGDYATLNTDGSGRVWTHVGAIDSVTGTTSVDVKLIAGTNPSYYSTANANSIYFAGTTGATSTEFAVKASPGAIKSIHCAGQVNNEDSYVTLYDLASGPVTVGTTAPTVQFLCTGGTVAVVQPGTSWLFSEGGLAFTTAITGAVCKTAACSSTPDVPVPLVIEYK